MALESLGMLVITGLGRIVVELNRRHEAVGFSQELGEEFALIMSLFICFFALHSIGEVACVLTGVSIVSRPLSEQCPCTLIIQPIGYPCSEQADISKDGQTHAVLCQAW